MAKKGAATKKAAQFRAAETGKIQLWQHLAKNLLRPFPDQAGNFLWVSAKAGAKTEQDLLQPKNLAKGRTTNNCEALVRMPTYLSEEGACIARGVKYLEKLKTPEATGLDFLELFDEDGGKAFLAACRYFDKSDDADKEPENAAEHAEAMAKFLTEDGATKAKRARRLALVSARLYGVSVSLLEQMALAQQPEAWAGRLDRGKQPAEAAKAFQSKPTLKRLRALWEASAEILAKDAQNQTKKRKAAAADRSSGSAESEVEESDSAETGDGKSDSESTSEKTAQKKSKKSKKSDKKKSKREKEKKKAEKRKNQEKKGRKGTKKEKKSKKRASTSASSSSSKPPAKRSEEDAEKSALQDWQLSEVQSFQMEWAGFAQAAAEKRAVEADFLGLMGKLPAKILDVYGLRRTALPAKLLSFVEDVEEIVNKGLAHWHKAQ